MNITDELERLSKLHKDGALNDEEFAQAKAKLLSSQQETNPAPREYQDNSLGDAANRYVSFRIMMGILGFILFLIFFLGFFLPMFHKAGGFR
jgi:hypothetical protein